MPAKLTTIPYSSNSYTITNTNIPYNWPAFLAASRLNNEYASSYAFIEALSHYSSTANFNDRYSEFMAYTAISIILLPIILKAL